ncbi:MAG: potassium channel family protein [Fimbriimonas sp.]|nr:potassium channel family protein [Fimbriimonas sp.]
MSEATVVFWRRSEHLNNPIMSVSAVILGIFCVVVALMDAFESVVLPRTVQRSIRLRTVFYYFSAFVYSWSGRLPKKWAIRQALLVAFAPLNFLSLITAWALLMIVGFSLIHWGVGTPLTNPEESGHFLSYLYFSGVTFFTLGYGDVVPLHGGGRLLAVLEAGLGFGFLALVIGYVPVIYSAFSRREATMLKLDSKAGSEPSALELVRRHAQAGVMESLVPLLKEWEDFSAQLLESYLSYPILAYYRSQHDDQSWLRSLTAVMDACILIKGFTTGNDLTSRQLRFQATATFVMGRHLLVDLSYVLDVPPVADAPSRLSEAELELIRKALRACNPSMELSESAEAHFQAAREMYEPYAIGLAEDLIVELPRWTPRDDMIDNWQTSAWEGVKHF